MRRKIIILLVLLIIVVIPLKDKIVELVLEKTCTFITGVKLDIGKMNVRIFKTIVEIKDMKLYNPENYTDRLMADIPEIYIDYDLSKILKGIVFLNEVRFHLKELDIIKNKEGKVNIDYLKAVKNKTDGEQLERNEKGKIPNIEIKLLYLKAEKVVYKNYSKKEPIIREFNVNLDQKYENINNPYTFIRLVISSVLRNTAIEHIVDIPMAGVKNIMKDAYKTGTLVIKNTVETTTDATGKLLENPGGTLFKAAKGLEGIFKGSMFKKKESSE